MGEVRTPDSVASYNTSLYDPLIKPPRPFEADYPAGAPVDAAGNLTHDIEGRPLVAPYIAGRASGAGPDQAIASTQFDAIAEGANGTYPLGVARSQIPGRGAGAFVTRSGADGPDRSILFDRNLAPSAASSVIGHELGHTVDELAGQIPTKGLGAELSSIYNSGNNGQRNAAGTDARSNAPRATPKSFGYGADDIPREHMAEAIRAYMADPNTMRTVAPKTAAAIRAAVNGDPRLNGTIQFNVDGVPSASPRRHRMPLTRSRPFCCNRPSAGQRHPPVKIRWRQLWPRPAVSVETSIRVSLTGSASRKAGRPLGRPSSFQDVEMVKVSSDGVVKIRERGG